MNKRAPIERLPVLFTVATPMSAMSYGVGYRNTLAVVVNLIALPDMNIQSQPQLRHRPWPVPRNLAFIRWW